MAQRRLYLAAYDISDPARLRRALEAIKGHASGGQRSVFECFLDEAERRELLADMQGLLDLREDRFMLLPLARAADVRTLGIAVKPVDPDYYYVG
jgi:CRISPR-associated protein Cas2